MSKTTISACTDGKEAFVQYRTDNNPWSPLRGDVLIIPIGPYTGPGYNSVRVRTRFDTYSGNWRFELYTNDTPSHGSTANPEPTPKKNMAELHAMSARELIKLVVERAAELQSLEAKYRLLEHDQADAVNNAFRGLLKRLSIEPDRAKLTEDDMYRLITSGLLGWEFPGASQACITAAERVMAAFDPRLIGSDLGDDPTDDHDVTMICHACGPTPHRYYSSPEAGQHWRCSGCGAVAPTSTVCRATSVQDCFHCDDTDCGDNMSARKPASPQL